MPTPTFRQSILARAKVAEAHYNTGRYSLAYSLLRHIAIDLLLKPGPSLANASPVIYRAGCKRLMTILEPYLMPEADQ